MDLEYTPEQKNRLEFEKLYAEVVDLRSWVRRWLGTLGGLLGILTAVASVVVTSTQWSHSTRDADLKMKVAEARLAQADKRDADQLLQEIRAKTDVTSKELEAKNAELAARETELTARSAKIREADEILKKTLEKLADAQQANRSLKSREFSERALDLIVKFEGISQPSSFGPGGILIGLGYELGLATKENFRTDWQNHLSPADLGNLEKAVGVTGSKAIEIASQFANIKISVDAAKDVFKRVTLPQIQARTAAAFPGYEKLPLDVQGALISVVYNAGAQMSGSRGEANRAIRDKVAAGDIQGIADQIRAMKNLSAEQRFRGLAVRREEEASLVESAKK